MSNEQDVQEKRLNAMKYKILKTEQENLKTREKTTDQKCYCFFAGLSSSFVVCVCAAKEVRKWHG